MKPEDRKEQNAEYELAKRHLPILLMDRMEPFYPLYIGYTVFEKSGKAQESPSAPRYIDPASVNADICIEYAYYYDYDIQHLYDLEHVWVYLDAKERICGCECSFHGMYLNAMLPGRAVLRGKNKVHLYVQPGKHAFLPDPEMFHLAIEFWTSCGSLAGKDGILTPAFIPGMPAHTPQQDRQTAAYIKRHFAFRPSEEYVEKQTDAQLIPWDELQRRIPGRIAEQMEIISAEAEEEL